MLEEWGVFIHLFGVGFFSVLVFVKTGRQVNPSSGVLQEILLESPIVLLRKSGKAFSSDSTGGEGIMFLSAGATRCHGESCSGRGLST